MNTDSIVTFNPQQCPFTGEKCNDECQFLLERKVPGGSSIPHFLKQCVILFIARDIKSILGFLNPKPK